MILDTCTLINLVNGEVLPQVLILPNYQFLVSPMVRDESSSIAQAVDYAVSTGQLGFVDDNVFSANEFAAAKQAMRLGNGETECILAAERLECLVACDDQQARRKAAERLGKPERVIGCIRLLRLLVDSHVLSSEQAFVAYQLMRDRGGFLPILKKNDFAEHHI